MHISLSESEKLNGPWRLDMLYASKSTLTLPIPGRYLVADWKINWSEQQRIISLHSQWVSLAPVQSNMLGRSSSIFMMIL